MPQQTYRLRIRTAADTADALVVTSQRTGTNPYIAAVPSGDGQEVDLLTGAVRTGAYVVEVVDAVLGTDSIGTLRLVTSQLYDGVEEYLLLESGDRILLENGDPLELELNNAEYGRVHLLSRKAFVEMSADNGATWTVWQAGFLSNVVQVDAIRYAFTVSNTRRVEQTYRAFNWSSAAEQTAFPQRGCVIGGPVIGGFGVRPASSTTAGGPIAVDSGGWRFRLLGTTTAYTMFRKRTPYLSLQFTAGSVAPNYELKRVFSKAEWDRVYAALNPFLQSTAGESQFNLDFSGSIWYGLTQRANVNAYPNLTAIITTDDGASEWRGSVVSLFTPAAPAASSGWYIPEFESSEGGNRLFVRLFDDQTDADGNPLVPFPATNTELRVRLVSAEPTKESPLYFDLHPVDVVTRLYDITNIPYKSDAVNPTPDVGSAQWMRQRLGDTVRIAARITEPQTMAEFLQRAIFGPFGFAARTGADGAQEFFITRELGDAIAYTIGDADVQGDAPPSVWSLDEGTAVTGFLIRQRQLTQYRQQPNSTDVGPPDNLVESAQPIQILNGDTTTFSTRIVEYDIPGMVHEASSFTPSIAELSKAIAVEGFERFGRGAPASEVAVLGTSAAAAAQVGDLVYLNVGFYPNKNYRIGESSVGARVAQIVRRDERPEGPTFKLVDAGLSNQPALAPALALAVSSANARRVAQFTITNAAALNNTAEIAAVVEYAVGATAPALAGATFARYTPSDIPVGPVQLPPVVPGAKVWARARTEQDGLFPSLWTAWQSVTLDAWDAPSSVAVSSLTGGSARVTWSNGTNVTDAIDVYVVQGSVAPSDWTPYRLTTMAAGSTTYGLYNLNATTPYVVGVAYVDGVSGARGNVTTASFTTTSAAMVAASRPAGLVVIAGSNDLGVWTTGIQLAVFPAAGETYTVIERAPNVVVGGVDTAGTYVELASVVTTQRVWVDTLPVDGTRYWYRTAHRTPGKADSSYTPGVSALAASVPLDVYDLSAVVPIVTVTTAESGTDATVTLGITDPQQRVEQVRFRARTNGGAWSAWTVDAAPPYAYTATIPAKGFVDIEYEVTGFAADGVSRVVAAGLESFDADTNATIVSAVGTFSLAGALTLSVQGDTDTNSFKYASATSNWANDAAAFTAAQAGTLVDARNGVVTLSGPYAAGTTVYIAIAGYAGASASGAVSGPYRYAFINGAQDTVYTQCQATQTNATDTSVEVTVTATAPNGTPQVRYTGLDGTATKFSGPALNVLSASGTAWVFTRGAFESGPSQASFEAVLSGAVTDTDLITIPEEQRDTVPLIARARVTGVDANDVTVRVAVADPYPQGANSATIAYSVNGLSGVSPATGQTVTPAATLTEASGTYVDFTIPRPAANAPPGRITFTATATNRTSDSDAADIVPKNPVPASLTLNYTNTDSEYVITWSVGSADTATLSIDGGAYATPSASPITVSRAPYEGGADKVYTFKSVGAAGDVLTSSVTVSKQLPYVANAATVEITGVTLDSSSAVTVSWTFANIPAGATWTVNGRAIDVGTGNITASGIALGTSPKTRQLTGFSGLGTDTIIRATVTAKDASSVTVASDVFETDPF